MFTPIVVILCVVATVSVFSSCLVVLTPVIFRRMHSKIFMHLIAFISIGDILGNLPYVFPFRPGQGNPWCDIQAFLNFAGYPMEWWWTTILIYFLYSLATKGHAPRRMWIFHIVCWGIPILTAGLTRIFGPFKLTKMPGEVCLSPETLTALYHEISYYSQFFLSLLIMFILHSRMTQMEYFARGFISLPAFQIAKRAVKWYPIALLIFWLPHFITTFIPEAVPNIVYQVLLIWKICHGLAISFIFFYQSPESRRLWQELLVDTFCPSKKDRTISVDSVQDTSIMVEDVMNLILSSQSLASNSMATSRNPSVFTTNMDSIEFFDDGDSNEKNTIRSSLHRQQFNMGDHFISSNRSSMQNPHRISIPIGESVSSQL